MFPAWQASDGYLGMYGFRSAGLMKVGQEVVEEWESSGDSRLHNAACGTPRELNEEETWVWQGNLTCILQATQV